jgi:fibronectin type 3 domain-containing protein
VSNAANSPTVESVTGNGKPTPQHSVDLSWDPSGDADIAGYNVYRGTEAGGQFTKINSALDLGTTYTDGTVQGGQTYYYYATAVDANGLESVPSNQVKAKVPSP